MKKTIVNLTMISLALFGLAWAGCSTVQEGASAGAEAAGTDIPEIEHKTLQPSAIDSTWAFLDDEEKNPFAKEDSELEYASIDQEKYDSFFKKAATVNGTVWLAEKHRERVDNVAESGVIEELIAGDRTSELVEEGEELSAEDRRTVTKNIFQGKFDKIAEDVEGVSKESLSSFKTNLYEDYPNLEKVVKWQKPVMKTFKPEELKGTAKELTKKSTELTSQAKEDFTGPQAAVAPKLAKELKSTSESLGKTGKEVPKIAKKMGETTKKLGTKMKEAGTEAGGSAKK